MMEPSYHRLRAATVYAILNQRRCAAQAKAPLRKNPDKGRFVVMNAI